MYTRTTNLFFAGRRIHVRIHATNMDIDFNKIDARIKSSGLWQETYPGRTTIVLPDESADEIKNKLINYHGITSVDGILTKYGKEVHKQMDEIFKSIKFSRE